MLNKLFAINKHKWNYGNLKGDFLITFFKPELNEGRFHSDSFEKPPRQTIEDKLTTKVLTKTYCYYPCQLAY